MSDGVIACVNWGDQTLECERRVCPCGTAIALSKVNVAKVAAMELTAICLQCTTFRLADDAGDALGMLVNGELYMDLLKGLRAAAALRDRN